MTKILLVDDEPDILETVRFFLIRSGYQVCIARNGKEALQQAKREDPDLILMDVMMPKMDGLEACWHFKTDACLRSIPIIMLTAKGEFRDVKDALANGADGYVTKPCDLSDLLKRIEGVLFR